MKRVAISIIVISVMALPASADETAISHLGDALAYMAACPGRLYYDLNVMHAYAEKHKLTTEEGTADFARVKERAEKTIPLLLARPKDEVCVEGNRFYGTFGTKAERFLTWW